MQTGDSDYMVTALSKLLGKRLRGWWYLMDLVIALIGLAAAVVTEIWWLLFIPGLALMEICCIYIGGVLSDALQERDAEIDRLRDGAVSAGQT